MQINFPDLDRTDVSKHQFVLLHGTDEGKITIARDKIIKQALPDSQEVAFNLSSVTYASIKENPYLLTQHLLSNSLFGDRSVMVIGSCSQTFSVQLLKLIKSHNRKTDNMVVLCTDNIKSTSAILKEIQKSHCAIRCNKDTKDEATNFIAHYLMQTNCKFQQDIPRILAHMLYPNRMIITSELEKLMTYKSDNKDDPISVEDIIAVNCGDSELSLDDLCVAYAFENIKVLRRYVEKIERGELNYMLVIRVLLNYFVKVWSVQKMISEGCSTHDAMSNIRPPIFYSQKKYFFEVLKRLNIEKSLFIIRGLFKIECAVKSIYGVKPHLILNNFLLIGEQ